MNKYFSIIESLNFPVIGATKECLLSEEERLKLNLKILQDSISLSPEHVVKSIIDDLGLQHLEEGRIIESLDDRFLYCVYSLKMLLKICESVDFSSDAKEDLISQSHKSLIISSIVDVAIWGLKENQHASFYKDRPALFKRLYKEKTNYIHLEFIVESFSPLLFIRALHIGKSLDDAQLWYTASIFSLLIAFDANDHHLEQSNVSSLQSKLQKMWLELSKKIYYRNLMLLFSSLPNMQRRRIHKEMLLRLWSSGGFVALLFAMAESQRSEDQSLDDTVSNLVAQPNFSIKAQLSLIKQVLQFLEASLKNKEYSLLASAGLLSLRKLYDNKIENKTFIKDWLERKLEPLIKPDTSKVIAMEWCTFIDLISLMFQIFCSSSVATLPSELLLSYLPLLLDLYSQVECHTNQNTLTVHLNSLILKILNNRSNEELQQIIRSITLNKYPEEWFQLSSNIQIKENPLSLQELKLSLIDNETLPLLTNNKHSLGNLVAIIKNSSYTLLAYQFFIILLQLLPSLILDTNVATAQKTNIDLLVTEEDIYNTILNDSFPIYENKIQTIKALEALVQFPPLKTLMNDNIKDIMRALQDILTAHIDILSRGSCEAETGETILMILLVLLREIIENCSLNIEDLQKNLLKPLKELESQIQNENLKYQLSCLLNTIKGEMPFCSQNCDTEFEEARSLMEKNESYLQVQGIQMMIKLLNKRDVYTVTNDHILTALALNTLKSPESYTFLNCVRLFVALVNVESGVLDLLSDEYLNDAATTDYRLVIGEAILKTSSEMGPLCYKHKNVLLNTFMAGSRSSLDEFRFSAFSNLSQMCRLLTYQVHSYFQELLNLIDCELTTGKYLPAKRAAVMVLSDLLAGMDNLFDYEEMLLPIYRLLKLLAGSETNDEKMRIHASNGLKCLSEKCKDLFRTALEQHPLEKEIKIMGIHDKPKRSLKSHILEIN